jgi:alpha/beta hydrolase fold.
MKNPAYFILLLIFISGCSSLNQNTYEYKLSQQPILPNSNITDVKLSCEDWTRHVVAANGRGEFKPIKFLHPDCNKQEPITKLDDHLNQIVRSVVASGKKRLLIFIHGGMNDYKDSLGRVERDLSAMMQDPDTYPIFIIWPSEMFDSYGDSIAHYYQGSWDHPGYFLTVPFKFAADLTEIGARSLLSYGKQTNLLLGSLCFNEGWRDDIPLYCGPNPNKPAVANSNNGPRNQDDDDRNPTNDPCEEADQPKGFRCVKTTAEAAYDFWRLKNVLLSPLKMVSIPIIDPLGERDWNSMISRTRFTMRKPCKEDVWGKGECGVGPVYKLFKAINENLTDQEITLIGHSMGAIVANEVVTEFPQLPYRNVVFMGAAVSIKEFSNSVHRVLAERVKKSESNVSNCDIDKVGILGDAQKAIKKPFCFFNLSLHPYAEATEENGFGAVPSGSLLEWIDTNFTQPADMADRTLGRWANISPLRFTLNQDLLNKGYMRFKRFGLYFNGPHSHGGLANLNESGSYGDYWKPEYWF